MLHRLSVCILNGCGQFFLSNILGQKKASTKVRIKRRGWDKYSKGKAQQFSHFPLGKALYEL
jgi:hypothetical protein